MMNPRRAASISVSVPGLRAVSALSVVAPKAVQRGLEAGILAAAIDIQGTVKNLIDGPVLNRQTGRLWKSITADTYNRAGRVVGIVGTNVKYAAIHEFGGTIRPKSENGVLVFSQARRNAKTGRFQKSLVFAKEVTIPKRPYMSRAFQERKDVASQLILKNVMTAVRRAVVPSGSNGVVVAGKRKGVGFNAD